MVYLNVDDRDKNMEFSRLSIKDVEALVGRTADDIRMGKKKITLFFYGLGDISDIRLTFPRWQTS